MTGDVPPRGEGPVTGRHMAAYHNGSLMRVSLLVVAVAALAGAAVPLARGAEVAGGGEFAARRIPAPTPAEAFRQHGPGAPVMVVAHRGYWRGAPENSADAITQAVAHKAQVVEIDLRSTKDGRLVLMHDDTVDRTTNGTGRVADLTLAQIRKLRLRAGLGGKYAALTKDRVPTLQQAMAAVAGSGTLVNLDRGWAFREQIYTDLVAWGQLDQGIFKSGAPVDEVTAFLDKDPGILYNHVVGDANAGSLGAFPGRQPQAYEVVFDRLTDPQVQPQAIAKAKTTSRVWMSTMWYGMAAGYTDEGSLRDPALGWGSVVDRHGADMILTDDPDDLNAYLDARATGRPWPRIADGTVRVQAEDYSPAGEGIGYYDLDDENHGGAARPYEGVDIGDNAGAIVVGWIRQGEWIRYDITVPRTADYRITARVSSPYGRAGRFLLDFGPDGRTDPVVVTSTTSHYAFAEQVVAESFPLTAGAHSFTFQVDAHAYQNFNLDYLQFTPR